MQLDQETLRWAVGVAGGILAFTFAGIGAALGILFRMTFRLGETAKEINGVMRELTELKTSVERVPLLEVQVGQLREQYTTLRSDIKHLLRRSFTNEE